MRENAIAFETSLAAVVPSNALHCVVPLGSPIQTAVMKMAAVSFISKAFSKFESVILKKCLLGDFFEPIIPGFFIFQYTSMPKSHLVSWL